jgi:ABC-type nitrate/sulfonate/bicarbonate transport system substrate-binding protein
MRLIVVLLLLASIASLGFALTGLVKSRDDASDRLHRGLRLRIGFSVALFLLLLLAWQLGLIEPHGLGG